MFEVTKKSINQSIKEGVVRSVPQRGGRQTAISSIQKKLNLCFWPILCVHPKKLTGEGSRN